MSNPFRTPEFKSLQKQWYTKLAKAGFEDAEKNGVLKECHSFQARKIDPVYGQSVQEYYRYAGHFLHHHKWSDRKWRRVWELHVKGDNVKEIAAVVGLHPESVRRIIRKSRVKLYQYVAQYADPTTDPR